MTREEIKNTPEIVDFMIDKSVITDSRMKLHKRIEKLCKLAIKALEQEPCEDAISRQAVDELSKELVHTTKDKADFLCNFWEGLKKLPPVTPQPKIGHWIHFAKSDDCSECRYSTGKYGSPSKYCPNCGAMMAESEGEE